MLASEAAAAAAAAVSSLSFYDTFAAALQSVGTAATLAAAGFYLHRCGLLSSTSTSSSSSPDKEEKCNDDKSNLQKKGRREEEASTSKLAFARYCQQVALPALFFTNMVQCSNGNNGSSNNSNANNSFSMTEIDTAASQSQLSSSSSSSSSSHQLFCPSVLDHWREAWILLLWPCYVVLCGTCIGLWTHWFYVGNSSSSSNSSNSSSCWRWRPITTTTRVTRKDGNNGDDDNNISNNNSTNSDSLRRRILLVLAVAFGNSTGLPTTLLGVLAESRVFKDMSSSSSSSSSSNSNMAASVDDPNLFLSVYLIVYPILQWSIGGWLLAATIPPPSPTATTGAESIDNVDVEEDEAARRRLSLHDFCYRSFARHRHHGYHHAASSEDDDESDNAATSDVVDCSNEDNVEMNKEQSASSSVASSSNGHDCRRRHYWHSQSSTSASGTIRFEGLQHHPIVTSHEERCPDHHHSAHQDDIEGYLVHDPQQCHNDEDEADVEQEELQDLILKSPAGQTSTSRTRSTIITTAIPSSSPIPSSARTGTTVSSALTMKSASRTAAVAVANVSKSLSHGTPTRSCCCYSKSSSSLSIQRLLNHVCGQPPVIGALLGLVVISIPALRHLFVPHLQQQQQQQQVADTSTTIMSYVIVKPLLGWFLDGLVHLGRSAIPMNMIVLGINLSCTTTPSTRPSTTAASSTKSPGTMVAMPNRTISSSSSSSSALDCQTILAAVVAKMIVMPILGIGSVALLLHLTSISFPPAMTVVLMMVWITPTANNVMVMVDLASSSSSNSANGNDDDDDKYRQGMARIFAWQYALAPLLLSFWVTIVIRVAHW
jgi:predicted permease